MESELQITAQNFFSAMDARERHALQFAVAASILLHALALFIAPGMRAPERAPVLPPLTALLRASPQIEAPLPVAREQPGAEPEKPRPVAEPKPAPTAESAEPQAGEPPPMSAPSSKAAPSVAAADNAAPETKPAPAAAAALASAALSAASSARAEPADPNALQGYKVQLAAFASKYKRYPRLALERGWEGIAEVKLTIGADGQVREAVIGVSSGHELLDREAVDMVRKAAPLTEITAALRNREFSVNLPIVFNIARKSG